MRFFCNVAFDVSVIFLSYICILYFRKVMRCSFLVSILVLSFLYGCKTATDSTSNGTSSGGDITFTEQPSLPQSGGTITGVELLPDHSMVVILNDKLYKVASSGAPLVLLNGDITHVQLALSPDGTVYTEVYDQSKDKYSMRRYDLSNGSFTSLSFPIGAEARAVINFKFAKNGDVYICYPDSRSVTNDIYYSSDKGLTWTSLPHPYGQIDVAFTPTGDILGVGSSPANSQVVLTSDHGANWQTLSTFGVNELGRNIFCRSNGDIITYDDGGNTVHVSHDAGKTFTKIAWGGDKPYTHQFAESGSTVYALGGHSAPGSVVDNSGLLRSDDGGMTWKNVFLCTTASSMNISRGAIVLGSARGIFFTADGKTWSQTGTSVVSAPNDMAVDKDGNILLTADGQLYRRSAGTWTVLASAGSGKIHLSRNGNLFCGIGTSIIYSNDNGVSWQHSKADLVGFYQWDVKVMGFATNTSNDIYAAIAEYNPNISDYAGGELLRSIDGGATFTSWYSQHGFTTIFAAGTDLIGSHQLFVGKHISDALISSDKGKTWSAYTAKYPMAINSQNNYISLQSSNTTIGFYLVNYSTKDSKELKTNIPQNGHTFITTSKFSADDHLYLLVQDATKGYSIYISDKAVQ